MFPPPSIHVYLSPSLPRHPFALYTESLGKLVTIYRHLGPNRCHMENNEHKKAKCAWHVGLVWAIYILPTHVGVGHQ